VRNLAAFSSKRSLPYPSEKRAAPKDESLSGKRHCFMEMPTLTLIAPRLIEFKSRLHGIFRISPE
jgi:hypothetical protein